MITEVFPEVGPPAGTFEDTIGADSNVNWSAVAIGDSPLGVVTLMSGVLGGEAGAVAVIDVSDVTVKLVAGVPPKSTAVAPVKAVPVMVTDAPPAVVPTTGETTVTVGAGVPGEFCAYPDMSIIVQKEALVHVMTSIPSGALDGAGVVHELPLNVAVLPNMSAISQNVVLGHETYKYDPRGSSVGSSVDQPDPLYSSAPAPGLTAIQNEDVAQERFEPPPRYVLSRAHDDPL
jgi:hypothetical protein